MICQVALIVGLATLYGFTGSQILFGVAFGLAMAHTSGAWARETDEAYEGIALLWYSFGAIFGCLVFTVWRQMLLCALAPLFGGFLLASGLGACAGRTFAYLSPGGHSEDVFLPASGIGWPVIAKEMLGASAGRGALGGACVSSFVAVLILGYGRVDPNWEERRLVSAVCVLLAYIFLVAVVALCTEERGVDWHWPVLGCTVWGSVTGISAWWQLRELKDEDIRKSFADVRHLIPDAWRKVTGAEQSPDRSGDDDDSRLPLTGMERGDSGREDSGAATSVATPKSWFRP